jgi:hypothetical protein
VYSPEDVMVPPELPSATDHVTAVLALPATVALKACWARGATSACVGSMLTLAAEEGRSDLAAHAVARKASAIAVAFLPIIAVVASSSRERASMFAGI